MRRIARVAATYGINPFSLTNSEFLALEFCISDVEADRELLTRQAHAELTYQKYRKLIYDKTGDMDFAEKSAARRHLCLKEPDSKPVQGIRR